MKKLWFKNTRKAHTFTILHSTFTLPRERMHDDDFDDENHHGSTERLCSNSNFAPRARQLRVFAERKNRTNDFLRQLRATKKPAALSSPLNSTRKKEEENKKARASYAANPEPKKQQSRDRAKAKREQAKEQQLGGQNNGQGDTLSQLRHFELMVSMMDSNSRKSVKKAKEVDQRTRC